MKGIFKMNIFRHLKWNEKKFNGTLNDTRFGLKARVSSPSIRNKIVFMIFDIFRVQQRLLH
jgi:hypothetical protein